MRAETLLAGLVILTATACGTQSSVPTDQRVNIPDDAVVLTMEPLFTVPHSGIEESRRLVIREEDEWNALWGDVMINLAPKPEAPAVDFDRFMVIVAAMGTRSTGGYTISIVEVRAMEVQLLAVVREVSPGSGCFVTDALSAPVTAVRVPRSDEPVSFDDRSETQDCL